MDPRICLLLFTHGHVVAFQLSGKKTGQSSADIPAMKHKHWVGNWFPAPTVSLSYWNTPIG